MTEIHRQESPMSLRNRIRWGLVLFFQAAVLGGWWWISPKGFPINHSRFWANSALPLLGIIVLLAAAVGLFRSQRVPRDELLVTVPGLWLGAITVAAMLFSQSLLKLLLLAVPAVFGISVLAWISLGRTWRVGLSLVGSVFVGGFFAFSQQAPSPSTHAIELNLPPVPRSGFSSSSRYELGDFAFNAPTATISLAVKHAHVELEPLLSFESRSPDRFWTNFAPQHHEASPSRKLLGVLDKGNSLTAFYQSDFASRLFVREESNRSLMIDSTALLPEPIYSHLNSYCYLWFATAEKISIVFSPCPETPIEILAADYPIGLAARIAFMNEAGFHVVEATAGEKGPFTELAKGSLKRGEPLALTFIVAGEGVLRIELQDWSTQASFDLSPTAGWGLPMNAIEFSRTEDGCGIWIALAATSVGRGWDSVGHAAGGYRNRVLVEVLHPLPSER